VVFLFMHLSKMADSCFWLWVFVGFFLGLLMVRVLIHGEAGPLSRLPRLWLLVDMFLSLFYLAAWESTWHPGWTE
jgi:hypothetical protein